MTEIDLDQLADWLESEQRPQDCLDIHGLHGYLTALAVCAEPLSDHWLAEALGGSLHDLPEAEAQWFADACVTLHRQIANELYADDAIGVTFEPTPQWQDSAMQLWCEAFMEVVFALPERWQHEREDDLATALLPIEVASGLFADEPDYQPIYRQPKLVRQMVEEIPELLTDLYLLLQAPPR